MNSLLSSEESRVLHLIELLIHKQRALLPVFRAALGPNASIYTLKKYSPNSISVLGENWIIRVHGVGAQFTNAKSKEVVDVHVGVFDSDNAFDAWRLQLYAASVHVDLHDFEGILHQLASIGVIKHHNSISMHYEFLLEESQG